jgi:sodium-dependent dicarboxylate transporter 2/3/5
MRYLKKIGLWLGPLAFVGIFNLAPLQGLDPAAQTTLAVAALMVIWWVTEALDIAVTALVPLLMLPLFGVGTLAQNTAPYASPVVFLFLGGFLLAIALEKSGLHRRIAYAILTWVGYAPHTLMLGFLLASTLLSMWISNTATAMMMLPIALSVASISEGYGSDPKAISALLLSVAIGSNLGGVGTLIGTPPNAIMSGYLSQTHAIEIGFLEWMKIGVPIILVSLPLFYFIIRKNLTFTLTNEKARIGDEIMRHRVALGGWKPVEIRVASLGLITALLWMFQPLLARWIPGLTDAGIGMIAGFLLFVLPMQKQSPTAILEWKDTLALPWGVLILFGGGLSLADAIQRTNLADWMGVHLSAIQVLPVYLVVFIIAISIIFISEVTSNSATAAAVLPIIGPMAISMGYDPMFFVVPATLAASMAFMLPVGTPPNAIVFSTGKILQRDMIKTGFWLNVISAILITLAVYLLL